MKKVHILKPEIISKIAAGEVIERPASVIKELLENSLDAQADTIEAEIKEAGKTLIKIKDNGHGIGQDDLKTIFTRHATSKIENIDDLYSIRSLGFRGEALYSIAAIAHVTVHSKTEEQETGWGIHLRGGEDFHNRPCSFNGHGTEIEVKELFFNTPARKKFLKSNTAEVHQILNIFIPYTLLRSQTRFSLISGHKPLLKVAPALDRVSRMADVLNLNKEHLLGVARNFPERDISIHLVLGDINIKRARRDMQFIFVNDRPVQNKSMSFHMNQVYRLIMPPELYPCFALYINVPAENLDVNIHPTKREVKIKNEQDICSILRVLCEQALMTSGHTKQVARHMTSSFAKASEDRQETSSVQKTIDQALKGAHSSEVTFDSDVPTGTQEVTADAGDYAYPRRASLSGEKQGSFIPENDLFAAKQENLQSRLAAARYIGGFMNKFLLFEIDQSILVVDQHAAAERITYEQLIQQMEKGTLEVQHLLSPVLIKLTPQEILIWEEAKDKLDALGLSVTQWDEETIAIHTHPLFLKDIEKTTRNLLAGENIAKCDHDTMARRACRSSVMAGDKLSPEQAKHVRAQLIKCLDPFTCPHGRPTVIEINQDFLDKQFLRA
ncbi:MAG: DNA mismatch repair endonuclease MutL [Candidatus Omnitrophica bacterium]|nr:DNA mismatch repair endonuclease MutL [Candidatus Omnitrophota bacterium]